MPDQQIFFDPERKRWKRLRRILDAVAVLSTLVVAGFIFNVLRNQQLPELLLPNPRHNYRALPEPTILERNGKNQRPARRKTARKPSEIPLNTGEGLRAAYYVQDDPASYSSLKEHIHQIDMLFPQWLHVDSPDGTLMAMSGDNLSEYPRHRRRLRSTIPTTSTRSSRSFRRPRKTPKSFPPSTTSIRTRRSGIPASATCSAIRTRARRSSSRSCASFRTYPAYRGLSLDIESIPDADEPAYLQLHPGALR